MTDNKDYNQTILNWLQKLCADCDKAPSLCEAKMQDVEKPELLKKWWPDK